MKKQLRLVSFILCILTILTLLCSCAPRPLAQGKLAKQVVGTVTGGSQEYEIYYEELYYLARYHYEKAKAMHGNDEKAVKEEAWNGIKKDILKNPAQLELCKSEGFEYNEKELRDRVNEFIESNEKANFDGDHEAFIQSMENQGLTDHFYRYLLGVEALYSDLGLKYQKNGIIPTKDEEVELYIKENFIRTQHVAIYVENGDDREEEYARAEEALKLLNDGKATVYDLISKAFGEDDDKKTYNEDTTPIAPTALWGNYFHKGVCSWGEDYEKAIADISEGRYYKGIVTAQAISPQTGLPVECFYIIERLPIDEGNEIETHLTELSDLIKDSILSKKVAEIEKKLTFEPNDYAKSLNLANLEKPKNGIDYQLVIAICVSVGAVILLICGIFVFRALRAKSFQKKLKKSKEIKQGRSSDKSSSKKALPSSSKNTKASGKKGKKK